MCVSKCECVIDEGGEPGSEEEGVGGGDMESRFINVATPAKIQGVLLHPAVTGCARLRCHGNTALRACSRSFIQFWTEQRAAQRMHAERQRERKTEKLLQSGQSKALQWRCGRWANSAPPSTHTPSGTRTKTHTCLLSSIKEKTKEEEPLALGLVGSFASW